MEVVVLQHNVLDLPSIDLQGNLAESVVDIEVSASSTSSNLSPISYATEVRGPEGQLCESKAVLDTILTKYTHINTNSFKGGANGRIRAEYMICECRYNHCKLYYNYSDRQSFRRLWTWIRVY